MNAKRVVLAVLVGVLTAGYMAPWAVAYGLRLSNTTLVFWVNLLLGWTVLGWIAALIIVFQSEPIGESNGS